jgi:uncharacterized protein (TIGR02453 family)
MAFTGFGAETFHFLTELEHNNNRPWFAENKARYDELVFEPAMDFIVAMGPHLAKLSGDIDAIPKRQGGSLMRVYRDTRFSKDKTPYKLNIGIQFRHRWGKDAHAPGFYCHISNQDIFLGAGMWRPDPPSLAAIRQRIDNKAELWNKILTTPAFKRRYQLGGSSLKRPPKGYTADNPMVEELKRKDFIAVCHLSPEDVASAGFAAKAARIYAAGNPLMKFLCDAIQAPY